jgi:hypothetical protein
MDMLLSWKKISKINQPTPTQPAGNSLQRILGTDNAATVLPATVT